MPDTRSPESRRRGRPPDVDSAATRARLLFAARESFALRGFDATTNKDLAAAAGITTSAIYHYFASKVDLYVAVYAEVQLMVYDRFAVAITGRHSLRDRFDAMLDVAVEFNKQDPTITAFVVGVAGEAQRHPELIALLRTYSELGSDFLRRLVAESHANGEIPDHIEPQAIEDLLNAVLSGLARFSARTGSNARHEAAVRALQHFLG